MTTMMRCQGVSVGPALDLQSPGCGVVHSAFGHAVNLSIGGNLWTLLAEDKADLPFGIRVRLSNFETLGLRGGYPVSVRAGFVGLGSRLVVDCRAAPRWRPPCPRKPRPGLEQRLAIVAMAARERSWHASAPMALAVRSALIDTAALGEVLARVVGRGPGATPSGDDVLVGALAVLTSPHPGAAGRGAAELLAHGLRPLLHRTTDLGRHLLRQAADGMFCREVQELVSALIGASSPPELDEALRGVIAIGATSGADICEGLLAFAQGFLCMKSERGSI
jgi:Protein of unknown function (DUF2877)